jgi:hypothetical protein
MKGDAKTASMPKAAMAQNSERMSGIQDLDIFPLQKLRVIRCDDRSLRS